MPETVERTVALPAEVASVIDYGKGGPTATFALRLGQRLVVQEGTEVRFCVECGERVRVWRFAVNPPDAYSETPEGERYWRDRPWLVAPCEHCWMRRDPDAYFAHRRDLSRMRMRRDEQIARRQGPNREVVVYSPESETL